MLELEGEIIRKKYMLEQTIEIVPGPDSA